MNAAANLAVVLLCVTVLTATSPVAGQTTPTVKAGTRVRVTHNEAYRVQQVARVVWSNADSAMVVFVDPPTGPVISSMTVIKTGERRFIRISDVEVSAGAKTNEMDGVVGGAAVGLGLGAFLGNMVGEDCGGASFCILEKSETTKAGAIGGLVIGAVIGSFYAQSHRTERWHPAANAPRAQVWVNTGPRGRGIGLSVKVVYSMSCHPERSERSSACGIAPALDPSLRSG